MSTGHMAIDLPNLTQPKLTLGYVGLGRVLISNEVVYDRFGLHTVGPHITVFG
jgi:hypothetical protein